MTGQRAEIEQKKDLDLALLSLSPPLLPRSRGFALLLASRSTTHFDSRNSKLEIDAKKTTQNENAGRRPSFPAPPSPPLLGRRPSSNNSKLARRPLTRPAAFGLGGGNKKPAKNSSGDAVASAAAEAEATVAKVGESVSEAAKALAAQVAAEAADAAEAGAGASSALSPAAAPEEAAAAASSLPPAPVRNAGAGRSRGEARSTRGKMLSLPRFAQQQQRRPTTLAGRRARGLARVLLYAGVAYALLSLGAAVMRVARRANSPRAQRLRTVDKNKRVVEALNAVFLAAGAPADSGASASSSPSSSPRLTPALTKKLKAETGFSGPEVFRKYLWYVLRERRFDSTAVNDLVALKQALNLSDEDVTSALKERAQRIYDKVRKLSFRERKIMFFYSSSMSTSRPFFSSRKTEKQKTLETQNHRSTATSCSTSRA